MKVTQRFKAAFQAARRLVVADRQLDDLMILQGVALADQLRDRHYNDLADYGFKVFSQWGEDGILQFLVHGLGLRNRTFVEFGVEDFSESNCRFLMMKDGWVGFVIDGSRANIDRLRASYYYWRYPLQAECAFITRENIVTLLERSGFGGQVGILSVDVDGVDWFVLSELSGWTADIVVVEYNALFGSARPVSVPYDPGFQRTRAHYSNLYYGASLPAFKQLLDARGYALVGTNRAGSNAFFVRRLLLNERVREVSLEACFRRALFRECRDEHGQLLLESAHQCVGRLGSLPLVDTVSGERLTVERVTGLG